MLNDPRIQRSNAPVAQAFRSVHPTAVVPAHRSYTHRRGCRCKPATQRRTRFIALPGDRTIPWDRRCPQGQGQQDRQAAKPPPPRTDNSAPHGSGHPRPHSGWYRRLQSSEREGFEPSVRFPVHRISSAAPSATRTPLLSAARTQPRRALGPVSLAQAVIVDNPRRPRGASLE